MYVSNVADFQNVPTPVATGEYVLAGYYSEGDGGSGTFVWVPVLPPATLPAADGGIIFHHSNDNQGYFKRLYSGAINVRWFGAIMGAIVGGSPITDVTQYVHSARDSSFAKNGGIYFPADFDNNGNPKPYVGAFKFYADKGEINIIGDGQGSMLASRGLNEPVLTLGWKSLFWRYARVYNVAIFGKHNGVRNSDGIYFEDPSNADDPPVPRPDYAGRWIVEKVQFSECLKAIHKPKGNIGNTYIDCNWVANDFAYYANDFYSVGPPIKVMHAGCDRFIGGHIERSDKAAICVQAQHAFGQLIIDGTIIEYNAGFAIFIKFSGDARMTYTPVELRNVWMEGNCYELLPNKTFQYVPTVIIDGTLYNNYYYHLEGVRSLSISNSRVRSMHLIESSVNLYGCRSEIAATTGPVDDPAKIDIDNLSSIVAYELFNLNQVSENIFVNSISYDGTTDIAGDNTTPTSVWGPLRTCIASGLDNIMMSSGLIDAPVSMIWPGYAGLPDGSATDILQAGTMINYNDNLAIPTLNITCKEMLLNPGDIVMSPDSFLVPFPQMRFDYFFWSIHAYLCEGDVTGYFGTEPNGDAKKLGQVIFKPQQWVCSYGIKKFTTEPNEQVRLWFDGGDNGAQFRFCHYQVLRFLNYSDAVSYMNSKAFAVQGRTCEVEG